MKTFPFSEALKHFLSQPDDRPLDMGTGNCPTETKCGCLLGNFLYDNGVVGFSDVSTNGTVCKYPIGKIAEVKDIPDNYIFNIFNDEDQTVGDRNNYGYWKSILKDEYKVLS